MDIAVVIPARYASSRFPGKPLALVAGKSVLARTHAIAQAARGITRVVVATDDERVAAHARSFGAQVVLTPGECPTGTDRAAAAVKRLDRPPDAVLNLQGDALLTPPWVLEALAEALARRACGMVTAAVRLDEGQQAQFRGFKQTHPSSGTTVVFDRQGRALYFSKAIVPQARQSPAPIHRHIGVYGYTNETLNAVSALPPSSLERIEGLEQLRALENGIPIQIVLVDYRGRTHWSIDAPEDVAQAEAIIAREGELV